ATVIGCSEGFGHAGAHHVPHAFSTANQPMQIVFAVTEAQAAALLDAVRAAGVPVFYMSARIEFGVLGDERAHRDLANRLRGGRDESRSGNGSGCAACIVASWQSQRPQQKTPESTAEKPPRAAKSIPLLAAFDVPAHVGAARIPMR
ncbi:hypothetical protein SAMN05445871_5440, partial [Paraburkholderia caballeronis]